MARDRLNISKENNNFVEELKEKGILDIDSSYSNKDIFLLAAALGIDSPKNLEGGKFGFVRLEYIHSYEKALISAITLGDKKNQNEIDKFSDSEIEYANSERCAQSGFETLKEIVKESQGDEDLLCDKLMSKLDFLYQKNIKSNLEIDDNK